MSKVNKEVEKEYTVKELSQMPNFPYKERMIRDLIKNGTLKAKFYGYQTLKIPQSAVDKFLKLYNEKNNAPKKKKK